MLASLYPGVKTSRGQPLDSGPTESPRTTIYYRRLPDKGCPPAGRSTARDKKVILRRQQVHRCRLCYQIRRWRIPVAGGKTLLPLGEDGRRPDEGNATLEPGRT
jgi:hypothetical protein